MKIFSPSVARNKDPILEKLKIEINDLRNNLQIKDDSSTPVNCIEIAAGAGEHAAYFTSKLSNFVIQPVEPDASMSDSIVAWSKDENSNVLPPIVTDIRTFKSIDIPLNFTPHCMLCVNMIHISEYNCTEALFGVAFRLLPKNGCIYTYGPYRENNTMCDSNLAFDASLKSRNKLWGVRDIEEVTKSANHHGFNLKKRYECPANNLLLVWEKIKKQ